MLTRCVLRYLYPQKCPLVKTVHGNISYNNYLSVYKIKKHQKRVIDKSDTILVRGKTVTSLNWILKNH